MYKGKPLPLPLPTTQTGAIAWEGTQKRGQKGGTAQEVGVGLTGCSVQD